MTERAPKDGHGVGLLVTLAAMAASFLGALTAPNTVEAFTAEPRTALAVLGLTLFLQLFSVEVYGRGSISVGVVGVLATAFTLGAGPAMIIAALAALLQWIRSRGLLHRAIFDAANLSLSASAAAVLFGLLTRLDDSTAMAAGASLIAGVAYVSVNMGLLCLAMSQDEGVPAREIWSERFRWLTGYYLAFGPIALAAMIAFERLGITGLVAFALPPALMMLSVRQYLRRTREAVEDARRANDGLRVANRELSERNDDLRELFNFAGGLAARAHNRDALVSFAQETLGRLTRAGTRVSLELEEGAVTLLAGGGPVGALSFERTPRFDAKRWERLRETLLPQLSTALESATLVEEVRRTHLATIAALSRSMEAKDDYTGGHTERVADVSVAIAKRFGYSGADVDAIEVGAVLHDIGKIGISERILTKDGPLDEGEWDLMREHPVISEYILAGVGLPEIVREIARSSHERMDGAGYPDGLAGEAIPLPARIVLVADAFDALTSDRSYRKARSAEAALHEIRAHAGTQFCPRVVDALEQLHREEPELLGERRLRAVDVA